MNDKSIKRIEVNGIPINIIRYADDSLLIANSLEDLQALLRCIKLALQNRQKLIEIYSKFVVFLSNKRWGLS